jgi:hypothetical protein
MLVPQLVHPERLRDSHRLPCYVQVFQIATPQRLETLAEALFGDSTATSQLRPLTLAILQQLQLAPLLPAPTHPPRPISRQPGLLLPGDRIFYLEVATDPTNDSEAHISQSASAKSDKSHSSRADEAQTAKSTIDNRQSTMDDTAEGPEANASTAAHQSREPLTAKSEIGNRKSKVDQSLLTSAATHETRPQSDASLTAQAPQSSTEAAPSLPRTPSTVPGPTALKTSIPAQFLKPWEFRVTREEVLFDLIRARSFFGRLRAGLRRALGGLLFNSEFRKWQVLLTGKSPDEQLWFVHPPKGASGHPFIREWATRTLELAGYDPRLMVNEWEIFWRRKEG